MGPRREVGLALVLAVGLATIASAARADVNLLVLRRDGAAQCADGAELRRLVALTSAGPSLPTPTHAYRVVFERSRGAYRVEITDDTASRTRALEDKDAACGPLGRATAVVLATMWSSENEVAPASPAPATPVPPASGSSSLAPSSGPGASTPAAPGTVSPGPALAPAPASPGPTPAGPPTGAEARETPAPTRAPGPLPLDAEGLPPSAAAPATDPGPTAAGNGPRTTSPFGDPRWVLGVGAALAAAIVRPVAPALFLDAGVEFPHASLAVGALWIPQQRFDVAPGSIGVQLLAGRVRGCAFLGSSTLFGLCATILAGQLQADGAGYSTNAEGVRPWFAVEPEAFVDRALFGWIRARVAAGAVLPFRAESFSATGAGVAYDTPSIGALFSLSVEVATP
jgi:hypothetical protein